MPIPAPLHTPPITNETVRQFYEWLFAPWVKELGLRDFSVSPGQAIAILPQNERLQFVSGAICGQVIMSAVDTVTLVKARITTATMFSASPWFASASFESARKKHRGPSPPSSGRPDGRFVPRVQRPSRAHNCTLRPANSAESHGPNKAATSWHCDTRYSYRWQCCAPVVARPPISAKS